jgi:hypothetical protein
MNVLKINIPEGFEIEKFDAQTGEVTLKPIKQIITPEELFFTVRFECEIDKFDTKTGEVTLKTVQPQVTPEELFLQFFDGCVVRFDRKKYPNSIFYFDKDGKYLAEFNLKYNNFWSSYDRIWSVFETEFSLNFEVEDEHIKLKNLLSKLAEDYFKLIDVTAVPTSQWGSTNAETHFKR